MEELSERQITLLLRIHNYQEDSYPLGMELMGTVNSLAKRGFINIAWNSSTLSQTAYVSLTLKGKGIVSELEASV